MMNPTQLATSLRDALGFAKYPVSDKNQGLASGLVSHISTGLVSHAPGTITGVTLIAPPFLTNGAGVGGIIAGLVGTVLASVLQAQMKFPNTTPQLAQFANSIDAHVSTGLVVFTAGNVTATGNTATASSPGVLVGGQAAAGQITGLTGPVLANLLASSMGFPNVSKQLLDFCNALASYIGTNAAVLFAAGTINGVTPAGGGPLALGTGAGGTIS